MARYDQRQDTQSSSYCPPRHPGEILSIPLWHIGQLSLSHWQPLDKLVLGRRYGKVGWSCAFLNIK